MAENLYRGSQNPWQPRLSRTWGQARSAVTRGVPRVRCPSSAGRRAAQNQAARMSVRSRCQGRAIEQRPSKR